MPFVPDSQVTTLDRGVTPGFIPDGGPVSPQPIAPTPERGFDIEEFAGRFPRPIAKVIQDSFDTEIGAALAGGLSALGFEPPEGMGISSMPNVKAGAQILTFVKGLGLWRKVSTGGAALVFGPRFARLIGAGVSAVGFPAQREITRSIQTGKRPDARRVGTEAAIIATIDAVTAGGAALAARPQTKFIIAKLLRKMTGKNLVAEAEDVARRAAADPSILRTVQKNIKLFTKAERTAFEAELQRLTKATPAEVTALIDATVAHPLTRVVSKVPTTTASAVSATEIVVRDTVVAATKPTPGFVPEVTDAVAPEVEVAPAVTERVTEGGVEVFHGKFSNVTTGEDFGGKHFGTQKASEERLSNILSSKTSESGPVLAKKILGEQNIEKHSLDTSKIFRADNPMREQSAEYKILELPTSPQRKALEAQGFKGVAYKNVTEDVGSTSYLVWDASALIQVPTRVAPAVTKVAKPAVKVKDAIAPEIVTKKTDGKLPHEMTLAEFVIVNKGVPVAKVKRAHRALIEKAIREDLGPIPQKVLKPHVGLKIKRPPTAKKILGIKPSEKVKVEPSKELRIQEGIRERISVKAFNAGWRAGRAELTDKIKSRDVETAEVRQAILVATKRMPIRDRDRLSRDISKAKSRKDLARIIGRIDRIVAKSEQRAAVAEFKEAKKELHFRTLRPKEQIKAKKVLATINEKTTGEKILRRMDSMLNAFRLTGDPGIPVEEMDHAREVLARQERVMLKEMDSEAIGVITNVLKHIKFLSEMKNKLLFGKQVRDADKQIGKATVEVSGRYPSRVKEGQRRARGAIQATVGRVRGLLGWARVSLQSKAEILGGENSTVMQFFVENFREGRNEHLRVFNRGLDAIASVIDKHKISMKGLDKTREITLASGKKMEVSSGEMLDLLNTFRDPNSRATVIADQFEGITFESHIKKVPRKLAIADVGLIQQQATVAEIELSQAMFDHINDTKTLRGDLDKAWLRLRGYELTRDNYWGILRDKDFLDREPNVSMRKWILRQLSQRGRFKHRLGGKSPIVISNGIRKYIGHMNHVSAFIGKNAAVEDATRLLENKEFADAVRTGFRDGDIIIRQMKTAVKDYAGTETIPLGEIEGMSRWFFRNFQRKVLGLQPHIVGYQGISYLNVLTVIDHRHWIAGFKGAIADINSEMLENSPPLRARYQGSAHGIMSPAQAEESIDEMVFGKKRILDLPLRPIHGMDWIVMKMVWTASKSEQRAMGLRGQELIDATARKTEAIVDETQPSWDSMTISPIAIEAKQSFIARLASMFSSQTNKNENMVITGIVRYIHSARTGADFSRMIRRISIPTIINVLFIEMVRRFFRWGYSGFAEKLEDVAEGFAFDVLKRLLGSWLIVREVTDILDGVAAVVEGRPRPRRLGPLAGAMADVVDIAEGIALSTKGKTIKSRARGTTRAVLATTSAIGSMTGLPTAGPSFAFRSFQRGQRERKKGKFKPVLID